MTHKDEELERILNEHCHCGGQKEYHKVIVDFILSAGYVKRDKVGLDKELVREILSQEETIDPVPPYRSLGKIDSTMVNIKTARISANAKSIIKINET
ncbi:MAG: hypothetical protein AABW88_05615 [Nanoarchaeota archaeon]